MVVMMLVGVVCIMAVVIVMWLWLVAVVAGMVATGFVVGMVGMVCSDGCVLLLLGVDLMIM